jgi:hypothetical protein
MSTDTEARSTIMQLSTCLREELRNATTSEKMSALKPLYTEIVERMQEMRGNIEWNPTEREAIVSTLRNYDNVVTATPNVLTATPVYLDALRRGKPRPNLQERHERDNVKGPDFYKLLTPESEAGSVKSGGSAVPARPGSEDTSVKSHDPERSGSENTSGPSFDPSRRSESGSAGRSPHPSAGSRSENTSQSSFDDGDIQPRPFGDTIYSVIRDLAYDVKKTKVTCEYIIENNLQVQALVGALDESVRNLNDVPTQVFKLQQTVDNLNGTIGDDVIKLQHAVDKLTDFIHGRERELEPIAEGLHHLRQSVETLENHSSDAGYHMANHTKHSKTAVHGRASEDFPALVPSRNPIPYKLKQYVMELEEKLNTLKTYALYVRSNPANTDGDFLVKIVGCIRKIQQCVNEIFSDGYVHPEWGEKYKSMSQEVKETIPYDHTTMSLGYNKNTGDLVAHVIEQMSTIENTIRTMLRDPELV